MKYIFSKVSQKKFIETVFFLIFLGALTSCQAPIDTTSKVTLDERGRNITPFPSVLQVFSCKPPQFAFIAAHRGTHEGSVFPENSLASLQALYDKNILFAEIDVARLKDGKQIIYHDGTWQRGSTGKGPVAASDWAHSQTLLLKDTNANITSFKPSAFSDVLLWAKNKMYLEIDFKSSVNEANVIAAIQKAEMIDQVILIAYTPKQAIRLHALAPQALISVGIFKPGDIKALEARGIPTKIMTAWVGRAPLTKALTDALRRRNIPILAASFFDLDKKLQETKDFSQYVVFAQRPDLIVTDYAFNAQQVLEMKGQSLSSYKNCLLKTN